MGDGTTSVVLLAAEVLKQIKLFVEDGLHPQVGRYGNHTHVCVCAGVNALGGWMGLG